MNSAGPNIQKLERLTLMINGLTLYTGIGEKNSVKTLQELIENLIKPNPDTKEVFKSYHRFTVLATLQNIANDLLDCIISDVNPFSRQASRNGCTGVDQGLKELAVRDLNILQEIAEISPDDILQAASAIASSNKEQSSVSQSADPINPVNWPKWQGVERGLKDILNASEGNELKTGRGVEAPTWLRILILDLKKTILSSKQWGEAVDDLANFYQQVGCGIFSHFVAFRWQRDLNAGQLKGVTTFDPITYEQIFGLKRELSIILENTEHFLKGFSANNMILYGNRGTGKSSAIKALLHAYVNRGLRLVELPKDHLSDYRKILTLLGEQPQKFIVFIDDLSFNEEEPEYKSLKSMLEGSLEVRPDNVLVYATSNRRHLIKEHFSDRQSGELHARDGMEEKLSLADRFGITVTFTTPDQDEYLKIVEGMVKQRNLDFDPAELRRLALQWEIQYNGRSGRTARQFVDYLEARHKS